MNSKKFFEIECYNTNKKLERICTCNGYSSSSVISVLVILVDPQMHIVIYCNGIYTIL